MNIDLLARRTAANDEELKDIQRKRNEADADLRWLINEPRGKRLLCRFFNFSGLFSSAVNEVRMSERNAVVEVMFAEGKKETARTVFRELMRVAPTACAKFLTEQEEKAHG